MLDQQLHGLSWLAKDGLDNDKRQLEMHQRLVHLATLRSDAMEHLNELDALKVTLTERKIIQQSRLVSTLNSRLAAAHAAVEPHRVALHDHIKALEKEAAFYSSILQGSAPLPLPESWTTATQRYKQLQQQCQKCQQPPSAVALSSTLAAPLQHVEAPAAEVAVQQLQQERAARLLAEEQQHSMMHEVQSLRLLTEQLALRLRLPEQRSGQQQQQYTGLHQQQSLTSAGTAISGLEKLCKSADVLQQVTTGQVDCSHNSLTAAFIAVVQELRQQLQQVYDAATQQAAVTLSSPAAAADQVQQRQQQSQQQQQQLGHDELVPSIAEDIAAVPQHQQQRRHLLLRQAELDDKICLIGSGDCREVRLRQAYQQQLRQVQARYQQELRRASLQHQQALQAQAQAHTDSLTRMTQQHSDACARTAAATAVEADLRQQLALLQQENQQLQQQVNKLQADVSTSTATAVALAQVQHEQQLMQAKQDQELLLQEMRQQLWQLHQQVQEQASSLPTASEVAALVQEAAASQLGQQEQRYQAALQEREQQHINLLQDLAQLRELQAEPSNTSNSNQDLECGGASAQLVLPSCGMTATQQRQTAPEIRNADGGDGFADGMTTQQYQHQDEQQHRRQQQQQQHKPTESPMSALIAAVLGPGSRAESRQARHVQQQQEQQQQQPLAEQQQQPVQQWQQLEQQCDEAVAELDQVLGLQQWQPARAPPAAHNDLAVQTCMSSQVAEAQQQQQQQLDRCKEARIAIAADLTHHNGVLQCLSPVHSCSSTVSSRSASSPPKARQQQQQHAAEEVNSRLISKQGCRTASWPQKRTVVSPAKATATAPTVTGRTQRCLRCGSNDTHSPGRCCFHPGLIEAAGPLLHSPEWHACRAHCTTDMPGCYCRREHYYVPTIAKGSSSSPKSSSSKAAGARKQTVGTRITAAASGRGSGATATSRAGSAPPAVGKAGSLGAGWQLAPSAAAAAAGPGCRTGCVGGKQQQVSFAPAVADVFGAGDEPQPRRVLPLPRR